MLEIILRKHAPVVAYETFQQRIEAFAHRIISFDRAFCTDGLLNELLIVIPDHATMGKLNAYKTAAQDVLETLHRADRLLVELIKIQPLGSRIKTMQYCVRFPEAVQTARLQVTGVIDACNALKDAPNLRDLLNVRSNKMS
jgi:hypothetical protein